MKRNLLLFLFAGALWTSCKKQDILSEQTPTKSAVKKPNSSGDGLWDVLGYGYNVLGEYANPNASTFKVLDIDRLQADYPDRVETDLSKTQTANLNVGTDAISYLKTVAPNISVGSDNALFKATIKASFKDTSAFSSQYVYSSYNLIIQQKRLKINATTDLLKNYLNATFLTDVQNQSPAYIVSHYGTHVLIDAILGAKLSIMYQSATTSSDRQTASSAGLDVGVGKIFSINTGINSTTSQSSKNYSQTIHYATHGGDPSRALIGDIALGSSTPPTVNISNWQSSSTVANSELIDIGTTGLLELSELVPDATKQAALHDYIVQYLAANKASLLPAPVYGYYNPSQNKHILSADPNLTAIIPGYSNKVLGFNAYNVQYGGTVPVYQFSNPNTSDHFYATNPDSVSPTSWVGYQKDGITFYAYTTQVPGTVPEYIYYNATTHDHIFSTISNYNAGAGWVSHGIGFYVFPLATN
ncbi:MAC/perforin domain-containing protein [Mucilaginibacter agri]|uniref:MACPF domain-containing protein n=1 Tax=Mucilaginibacter agri TaxID=2695265 RepID=A0A966DVA7_9SPHI|nr:MAC/perforin domain-containing protein [Mucilaginibacter agri]NCD70359.1 hypothetical protein [Mucilaginibacter agri]